ncbi:MAG: PKD domain-containing protein [Candidatus Heimdallarchaeota archaeon]
MVTLLVSSLTFLAPITRETSSGRAEIAIPETAPQSTPIEVPETVQRAQDSSSRGYTGSNRGSQPAPTATIGSHSVQVSYYGAKFDYGLVDYPGDGAYYWNGEWTFELNWANYWSITPSSGYLELGGFSSRSFPSPLTQTKTVSGTTSFEFETKATEWDYDLRGWDFRSWISWQIISDDFYGKTNGWHYGESDKLNYVIHYYKFWASNNAPVADPITISSPASPSPQVRILEGQSITLAGSGSDADGDSITAYVWDPAYAGMFNVLNPFTSGNLLNPTPTFTYDTPGTYTVAFAVVDALGDWSTPQTATVIVLADTDNDGLADVDEISIYHTNPYDPDTDDDGLMDGAEANNYGTDPLDPDTDGDGVLDGSEVQLGTHPLDPNSRPAMGTHIATVTYYSVYIYNDQDEFWPNDPGEWKFYLTVSGNTISSGEYPRNGPGYVSFTPLALDVDLTGTTAFSFVVEATEWDFVFPLYTATYRSATTISVPAGVSLNQDHYGSRYYGEVLFYYSYFIHNNAPVANPITGGTILQWQSITFSGSGSDPESDSFGYQWDMDYTGSFDVDAYSSSPTFTYTTPGTYTVAFRTIDAFDEPSSLQTATVIVLADTDGDGLTDEDEINVYGTDPLNPDTDGDGFTDYDEINVYGTDPLDPDTTPPSVTLSINNDASSTISVDVSLAIDAVDDSDVVLMRFSNSGSSWTAWESFASSKSWTIPSGDGLKSVFVQVKDPAGNIAETSDDILLDTTIGNHNLQVTYYAASIFNDHDPDWLWSIPGDWRFALTVGGTTIYSAIYTRYAGYFNFPDLSLQTTTSGPIWPFIEVEASEWDGSNRDYASSYTIPPPSPLLLDHEYDHYVRIGGNDDVGHYFKFTLYNTAPTANPITGGAILEGQSITLQGIGSDPDGDAFAYQWDMDYDETTFDVDYYSSNPTITYTTPGTYTVAFRTVDVFGKASAIQTATVEVNALAPTLTLSGPPSVPEGADYTLSLSASGAGAATINQWTIDWGDGLIETIPGNPTEVTHIYADGPASYTISATATNSYGTYNADNTLTVTIADLAPGAAFSWAPEPQNEGTAVLFTDLSTSSPDAIVSWAWDFSGLGSSSNQHPSFTFMNDGTYTVTLTVTDDDGSTHTVSHDVTITDLAPGAAFSWAPEPQNEGTAVLFTDLSTSSPDSIFSWAWDFGGLGTSAEQHPSFTFIDDGTYTVTLIVTDDDGSTDTISHDVTILDLTPTAAFSWAPEPQDEGSAVLFTDESTSSPDSIVSWAWDFGGLGTSAEQHPSFTFIDDGTYTVTLIVTDDDASTDTVRHTITINNVAPSVEAGVDQTVNEGGLVSLDPATFTDDGTGDTHTATIDWGDGTIEAGLVAEIAGSGTVSGSHTYVDNGDYYVAVLVIDDDGAATLDMLIITVNNVAPSVQAGADQTVNEGELVSLDPATFTDDGTGDTHTAMITWGDGTVDVGLVSEIAGSGTVSGSHTYADNGDYTITVTVTDDDSTSGSDTLMITVNNVAPSVEAGAHQTVNEGELVSLDPATFTDDGTGDTHTAMITWGDGTVDVGLVSEIAGSGTVSGSHTYADNGDYTITVTVTDDDGAATSDALAMTVNNVAPLLSGTADQIGNEASPIIFLAGTVDDPGADTFEFRWDWDNDGTYDTSWSSTSTASYTWADDYTGTVAVQVRDDDGGIGSDTLTVTVNNVAPSVIAGAAQTVDEGSLVTFAGAFSDPGADTHTYQWNFGDGATASGTLTPTHVYADDGVYTVMLAVTDDDNGMGTDILSVTVLNVAPTVSIDSIDQPQAFALPDLTILILDPTVFTGSATDPGADTLTYDWAFGDNAGASGSAVIHSYDVPDAHTVTLTVEDDDGGVGTASVGLTVWGPRDLKTSVISDLKTLKTGEWWVDKRLDRVIWYIERSMNEKFWDDETHLDAWYGWRVFFYEFLAEIHLEIRSKLYHHFIPMLEKKIECLQAKGYDTTWLEAKLARMQALVPVFETALFRLAKADELLARVAIMDAESTPAQNPKWQARVDCYLAKATTHMTKAAERLEDGRFAAAIWYYKMAWIDAQQAMKWANKTSSGCSCFW